jgi:Fe-S cluster biogenesis protein NfuA
MSQTELSIMAEPVTEHCCRFAIDRPIYEYASFFFGNPEKAQGSPLAARLFAIDGVTTVLLAHDQLTVDKSSPEPWQVIAKQIGAAIRDHFQSGEPAVTEATRASLPPAEELRDRVQSVLDSDINLGVASHGGVVQLIDVRDNNVFIQMGGGCQGCGQANVTLKHGVETAIRRMVPEVGAIYDTTDHAAGRNPYYASQ